MVKHFQQQLQELNSSCIISSRKRVSFKPTSEDRYYSLAEDEAALPIVGVSDGDDRIERLLKVMQSLNVARIDSVERFAEISKLMNNTERINETFGGGPKRIASDVNIRNHQKERRETIAKSINIRSNEVSSQNKMSPHIGGRPENEVSPQNEVRPQNEVSPPKEVRPQNEVRTVDIATDTHHRVPRIDGCKQALAPVTSPSQTAVDSVKRLSEIARKRRTVLRMSSVDGPTDDDAQSSSESTATDDTGSGSSSRRGSGDSLQEQPCRGYSTQRRHGRKDSLGTAVDFTRLIPTLVSDNEDFRQKEYKRTLSVQPLEPQHSTW